MEPIYVLKCTVPTAGVDCFDRMKPSFMLSLAQDMAGEHSTLLGTSREALEKKRLFWAVIRQKVQITRPPASRETITLETWPMPTTRTAYPRATVAYDEGGNEVFRCISLWVLMDLDTRAMILPGKSGVTVEGLLRGSELSIPGSLAPRAMEHTLERTVRFTELDINGHLNNCRYLDWVDDLMDSDFHREHPVKEFSISYLSEAQEGAKVALTWEFGEDGALYVDSKNDAGHRVFAAKMLF